MCVNFILFRNWLLPSQNLATSIPTNLIPTIPILTTTTATATTTTMTTTTTTTMTTTTTIPIPTVRISTIPIPITSPMLNDENGIIVIKSCDLRVQL